MQSYFKISILCIALLVMASSIAGCNGKPHSTINGVVDISTGVHTLTGVNSRGVPMAFEGMQATVLNNLDRPKKVLILTHGDLGPADFWFDIAESLAESEKETTFVLLARSGCTVEGRKSIGTHKDWDSITLDRINMFARAVDSIRSYYGVEKVYAFGHSGGAATLAVILGKYPELMHGAVLASMPAHIAKYQIYRHGSNYWKKSLSPHKYVKGISPDAKVIAITGSQDTETPPWLAEIYVSEAQKAGRIVKFVIAHGANHDLLIDNAMIRSPIPEQVVRELIQSDGIVSPKK